MIGEETSPHLSLILGGARSGKSSYAQNLALMSGKKVLYVATAEARDDEMLERITAHRASRPGEWSTLEAPQGVGEAVCREAKHNRPELILLDCLTLLVSNVIIALPEDSASLTYQKAVEAELDALLAAIRGLGVPWLVVSNEVGLGLVPPYALGRIYRDVLGWANQRLAAEAGRVIFMVSGIPMVVKG